MESSTGIQVLITSHNCASYLNDCFNSIETALAGYKWMMVFCDDVSTDDTEQIINNYKTTTSADSVVYQKYNTRSVSIPDQRGNYRETLRVNDDLINILNWKPKDRLKEYIENLKSL